MTAVLSPAKFPLMVSGKPDPDPQHSAAVRAGHEKARELGVHIGRPAAQIPEATRKRLTELRQAGTSWRVIAETLNAENVPTPSGQGRWHLSTVRRTMQEIESEDSGS